MNLFNPSASVRPYGMRLRADYGGILGYAADHGVGAAIYSPLAGGAVTDNAAVGGPPHPLGRGARDPESGEVAAAQSRALRFLSRELSPESQMDDHSLAEAGLRWVLAQKGVTVALGGFSDREQVEENASYSGKGPLSEENMAHLEQVWRGNFGLDG